MSNVIINDYQIYRMGIIHMVFWRMGNKASNTLKVFSFCIRHMIYNAYCPWCKTFDFTSVAANIDGRLNIDIQIGLIS